MTLMAGICLGSYLSANQTTLEFDHTGNGSTSSMTVFRAATGARVLFCNMDGTPPDVQIGSFTRVVGLWLGGRWTPPRTINGNPDRGGSSIALGGFPGHKELINCTLFGYREIDHGGTEYTLIRGTRIVQTGAGKFSHGIYLSGGNTAEQMGQHSVLDQSIIVGGEGYAVQGWHRWRNSVITRNFIAGHFCGVVLDGCDHIVANNFF
eukprot:SAG22_NODE_6091_length_900_cov_1.375780_1_plen_206_part_10